MVYFNNQWIFVGSSEFYNNGGLKFSIEGFVYRVDGNLTPSSRFDKDITDAKQLEKIRILNNNLVVFGESFPNPDSCIYTLEDTELK
jgi:N-acetylneuraminic acid mutarotase